MWDGFIAVRPEPTSEFCVPLECTDHALGGFNNAPRVFKAIMACTGINQMRHSKLPNTP